MQNDEKILKALEALQADVAGLKQGQDGLQADVANIKKGMATKQDVAAVRQDMAQGVADVRQDIARTNTALDAVAAGQKELQETVATKADVIDVGAKVEKLKKR